MARSGQCFPVNSKVPSQVQIKKFDFNWISRFPLPELEWVWKHLNSWMEECFNSHNDTELLGSYVAVVYVEQSEKHWKHSPKLEPIWCKNLSSRDLYNTVWVNNHIPNISFSDGASVANLHLSTILVSSLEWCLSRIMACPCIFTMLAFGFFVLSSFCFYSFSDFSKQSLSFQCRLKGNETQPCRF